MGAVALGVKPSELRRALPSVTAPYLVTASEVGASLFEAQRAAQGAPGRFYASTLTDPEAERVASIAGYALAESGGDMLALQKGLQCAMTRLATERSNDTVIGNAAADTAVRWRYQRVPRAGCCEFCGMLASRGAVYHSEASAGGVVGRGVPIPPDGTPRKRGGQAKGIKPRGSQRMGETYHDNCYCDVVAVMNGVGVQLSNAERNDVSAEWWSIYETAKAEVDSTNKLTLKNTEHRFSDGSARYEWYWVDESGRRYGYEEKSRDIINAMRRTRYADEFIVS